MAIKNDVLVARNAFHLCGNASNRKMARPFDVAGVPFMLLTHINDNRTGGDLGRAHVDRRHRIAESFVVNQFRHRWILAADHTSLILLDSPAVFQDRCEPFF